MTWHGKLVTAGRTQALLKNDVRDLRAGPSGIEKLGCAGIGTSA